MPLLRYIGFAGSALVLLLFGLSWCFPQPVSEPIRRGIDRPVIRISSVERLPERLDIDTSLPTIVPQHEQRPILCLNGQAICLKRTQTPILSNLSACRTPFDSFTHVPSLGRCSKPAYRLALFFPSP